MSTDTQYPNWKVHSHVVFPNQSASFIMLVDDCAIFVVNLQTDGTHRVHNIDEYGAPGIFDRTAVQVAISYMVKALAERMVREVEVELTGPPPLPFHITCAHCTGESFWISVTNSRIAYKCQNCGNLKSYVPELDSTGTPILEQRG